MKPTPWGYALNQLLGDRSLRSLQTSGIMDIVQYKRMRRSKLGPSVAVLDRYLSGLGLTWHDWARAFEKARRTDLSMVAESSPTYRVKTRASQKKKVG